MPSALANGIAAYLEDLRLRNASPHTLRNYGSDFEQFVESFSPPGQQPPAPGEFTPLQLREWLGSLYAQGLDVISIRRKLAAVRSLFRYCARQGLVTANPAKLVKTPKP